MGSFVVFEGIDVSGKSTQARRVATAHQARFAFEPGDTELGQELRRWVLDATMPMAPATEALMMLTDRSHHVRSVIEPTLAAGGSVVCDRFYASTLAYQGYGRGVDLELLEEASHLAIGSCRPDVTVLLDLSVEVVEERRGLDHRDRFESSDLDFHQRVREGYLVLARTHDWIVIDGSLSLEDVSATVDERLAHVAW